MGSESPTYGPEVHCTVDGKPGLRGSYALLKFALERRLDILETGGER